MTDLATCLEAERLSSLTRGWLERLLAHPSALAPHLAPAARRHGFVPAVSRPGSPVLLAATRNGGSLWALADACDDRAVELGTCARDAWRNACRVAARVLPIVADAGALDVAAPPRVRALWQPGGEADAVAVVGASFGLAFCLGRISAATGVAPRTDTVATGVLTRDGRVERVERLDAKLDVVRRWMPGVTRVLVAATQEGEARAVAGPLAVVPVGAADEAWTEVFEQKPLDEILEARWAADPAAAAEASGAFFRLVTGEPGNTLRWAAVARGAHLLADHANPIVAWRAHVAHAVASRHAGEPLLLPPRPPGLHLRRPIRLALLAHEIQAHNDAVSPAWQDTARRAVEELAPDGDEGPDELRVLGALGRLYVAWGRLVDGAQLLERVVTGWFELEEHHEASFAICELLRARALQPDADGFARALADACRCAGDLRTSPVSRVFLQLAIGRGHALLGDARRARQALSDAAVAWAEAPVHVDASRLRWLGRLGEPIDALAERADHPEVAPFWALARADAGDSSALGELTGADVRALERARLAEPGAGVGRWLEVFPY